MNLRAGLKDLRSASEENWTEGLTPRAVEIAIRFRESGSIKAVVKETGLSRTTIRGYVEAAVVRARRKDLVETGMGENPETNLPEMVEGETQGDLRWLRG